MAISNFLRNVFGAADAPADVDFDDKEPAAPLPPAPSDIPAELLDAVAAVINAQLPPFAAQCIDPQLQRNYIAHEMGRALSDYAEALNARQRETSGKNEEQKAALLSEQRQRRALAERNRDLESKIEELTAEIDQHKLTIQSLMNKMRVAEVADTDATTLREDFDVLTAELAAKNGEIADLRNQIEELTKKLDEQPEAEKPKRKRSPRKQKPQAYDPENDASADLDSIDWLLPGGVPAGHVGLVSDPEFGYQPPKHTPAPDSDSQLTLF